MDAEFLKHLPIPACIVGTDGNITYANSEMKDVILFEDIVGANFFALTGVKRAALINANDERLYVEKNERLFKLRTNDDADIDNDIVVFFEDKTRREAFRNQIKMDQPAIVFINIDNFDQLMASSTESGKRAIPSQVDDIVRQWGAGYDAPVLSTDEDTYVMFSTRAKTEAMIEDSFSVLDTVRSIETQIDFPVSISIGIGISEESMDETKYLAQAALELALGRGGDQAVVKIDDKTNYYGGTIQTIEKNNRGKARVIAHAMKRLIEDADKVIIMGHRWPDMDAFGSAIGAFTICRYLDKEAYIVVDKHNEALDCIYRQADDKEEYNIIKASKALKIITDKTLLIVVDCNRPMLVESEDILNACRTKVVIDHHRMTDDSMANPTVAYIESYASSASELMVELIQYFSHKRFINKFEAESMLAGIMVDTNNFSGRTGVRTFEAAAWLKRAGADTTEVKRFFQTDQEDFKYKAGAIANAVFTEEGIVYALTRGQTENTQIINAQVADELLMVKGVRASFVLGQNEREQTVISARSLGDINVQYFMEKLGGGGHFTSAATQMSEPVEIAMEQLKKLVKDYIEKENEE